MNDPQTPVSPLRPDQTLDLPTVQRVLEAARGDRATAYRTLVESGYEISESTFYAYLNKPEIAAVWGANGLAGHVNEQLAPAHDGDGRMALGEDLAANAARVEKFAHGVARLELPPEIREKAVQRLAFAQENFEGIMAAASGSNFEQQLLLEEDIKELRKLAFPGSKPETPQDVLMRANAMDRLNEARETLRRYQESSGKSLQIIAEIAALRQDDNKASRAESGPSKKPRRVN